MAPPSHSTTTVARPKLGFVATVLASIAPVLFVVALVYAVVPVENPGVQQCGTPVLFVVRATPDAPLFSDEGKPIHNWNEAQLRRANDQRCSIKAADRMVPAAIAFAAFLVVGTTAVGLSWLTRRAMRREIIVTEAGNATEA